MAKVKKNETIFEKIDTEEKAYWLGFLAADGCVRAIKGECYSLVLKLKGSDNAHLEKFRKFLESDCKIRYYKTELGKSIRKNGKKKYYDICSLATSSKKMIFDLIKHGVGPKKSLTLEFPKNIDDSLIRHYTRGYIDGDGCWSSDKKKYPTLRLFICGTKKFLKSIDSIFLKNNLISNPGGINKPSKIHIIKYGGNNIMRKIASWLYTESTIFLERKLDILKRFKLLDETMSIIPRKPINHFGIHNPKAKSYKIISPTEEPFYVVGGLRKFCDDNGIIYRHLLDVAKGRRDDFMGWKCEYVSQNAYCPS